MIFGRRRREKAALDALTGAGGTCPTCGLQHRGMFDLAAAAPDIWEGPRDYEPNGALRFDGDFLSEDFCVLGGEHFFVRCVLEIPVRGLAQRFGFGCWSTLSRRNFELYVEHFDEPDFTVAEPWTSWLGNQLKGFPAETANQPCRVAPQPRRQRPLVTLMDESHPLARAQIEGVEPDLILDIYAANGHPLTQP